jgi:SPP1 gp7 family putative phage head morphogenesis protein
MQLGATARRFDAGTRFARAPKRKPKKLPSNAYRRAHSSQPPVNVEMLYVLAARRVAARFGAVIRRIVLGHIEAFTNLTDVEERADAADDDAKQASAKKLAKQLGKKMRAETATLTAGDWEASGEKAAKKTEEHSKKEFRRLGIDVRKEPMMTPLIDGWRKDNVALIKNMHEEQVDKVEKILDEGWGRHPKSLAKDIEDRIGVSKSRAELIARDQVLTLHAKITRHRHKAAGIKSYIWTTSQDERVRPEHAELEGEEFSWDEGGDEEEGHPGEAVNCRCVAFPVLEELED